MGTSQLLMAGRETHPVTARKVWQFIPAQGGIMNKYRELSCLKILALILLALILTGCLGGKAQSTPTPPATATASEQGGPVAPNQLPATITPPAEEVASPTPEPVKEATPTETPSPTETAPAPSQTPTQEIAPTDTAAPALGSDFYEPIKGCARSTLHWGDVIRIARGIEYVRIRSSSDTHPPDNIVRRLYRTELAKITGLPYCNYGWIVWPIQTADGTRGWVPESNGTDYWLVKVHMAFPTATIPSR
jgi:hypothetical protein